MGSRILEAYNKLRLEKSSTDGYLYYWWVMLDPHLENSFNNSNFKIEEMFDYFKDKNHK